MLERSYFVESIPQDALGSSNPACSLYRLVRLRRQVRGWNGREAGKMAKMNPQPPDAPFTANGRA